MNWHFRTRFLLALSAIYLVFGFVVDSSFSATTSPAPTIVTRFTFILPLNGTTQINAYFDLNSNLLSTADVTGWQCQVTTSTVVDQNNDGKINDIDFNKAFEKVCPWKIGRAYDNHKGIDFYAKTGTDVFAAAAGTVITVEDKWADNEHPWQEGKHPLAAAEKDRSKRNSFGNLIVTQNDVDGSYAYYGHLQAAGIAKYGLKVDDKVERGQPIATADNTGSSRSSRGDMYGDHLHFEIRDSSKLPRPVDPFSENLWITDGTPNVTTAEHILTAEEYFKQQDKIAEAPAIKSIATSRPSLVIRVISWLGEVAVA